MTQTPTTIFAPATPYGRAAVQIIRISGPEAATILKTITAPAALPPPRQATLTTIIDLDGTPIDKAISLFFPTPHSATGEDMAELHLHGSPLLTKIILRLLAKMPRCRLADPGEFTRRAFINEKIDLAQAEAIGDIIDADTVKQHQQALQQLEGHLGTHTETWRQEIISLSARLEALIDFSDEDLPSGLEQIISTATSGLCDAMRHSIEMAEHGILNRDGITVAIIGRPNVGKSTLLNVLAGDDRAIVSPEAGTTRDTISVSLDIDGFAIHLVDTAGIRTPEGDIEKEGIKRALAAAHKAAIVIILLDGTEEGSDEAYQEITLALGALGENFAENKRKIIPISTKADIAARSNKDHLAISALTGAGMAEFKAILAETVQMLAPDADCVLLTRERHRLAVETALEALSRALSHDLATAPELMAEEFRIAAAALGRVTGKIDVEDLLDEIFSSFCIGK